MFAPSPDGKSLAYVELVPHGAPAPHDSARVMVDDAVVYPPEGDSTRHVVRHIVWSGASVVFADDTAGHAAIVAVNSQTGNVEAKVPIDAMPSSIAPGDAPDVVDVVVGGKAMCVDLRAGTIAPAARLHEAAEVVCPQ